MFTWASLVSKARAFSIWVSAAFSGAPSMTAISTIKLNKAARYWREREREKKQKRWMSFILSLLWATLTTKHQMPSDIKDRPPCTLRYYCTAVSVSGTQLYLCILIIICLKGQIQSSIKYSLNNTVTKFKALCPNGLKRNIQVLYFHTNLRYSLKTCYLNIFF